MQSDELEEALPCLLAEAPPPEAEALPLPEAEEPELGEVGVLLDPLPLAPADVLLPLCAHAMASIAAAIAAPIAFKFIETSLGW